MHLVLGAAPLLCLLSRVHMVRVGGGILGGLAAVGWLAERAFAVHVRLPLSALAGGLLVMLVVDRLAKVRAQKRSAADNACLR